MMNYTKLVMGEDYIIVSNIKRPFRRIQGLGLYRSLEEYGLIGTLVEKYIAQGLISVFYSLEMNKFTLGSIDQKDF